MSSKAAEHYAFAESSSVFRAADKLTLAASPAFALMAFLTPRYAETYDILCGAASGLPWNDMVAMYLLMSISHLPPWLRLFARRRGGMARTEARSTTSL
jgi:hypothetical protein